MHSMTRLALAVLAALAVALLGACSGSDEAHENDGDLAGGPAVVTPAPVAPAAPSGGDDAPPATATSSPGEPVSSAPLATATSGPDDTVSTTPVALEPVDGEPDGGIVSVPPDPLPATPADRKLVLAPIDSADILIAESFPVQYSVAFVSGLPSGCAEFHGVEVERTGTTVTVTVWNSEPTGSVMCTAIYGMRPGSVSLGIGTDYTRGVEYTVRVNDRTLTFIAQ